MLVIPKRKANSVSELTPKLLSNSSEAHYRQADYIKDNSFTTTISCDYCKTASVACLIDRSR
jgi:hypothetical protein